MPQVDWWALGVLLVEMCSGAFPNNVGWRERREVAGPPLSLGALGKSVGRDATVANTVASAFVSGLSPYLPRPTPEWEVAADAIRSSCLCPSRHDSIPGIGQRTTFNRPPDY